VRLKREGEGEKTETELSLNWDFGGEGRKKALVKNNGRFFYGLWKWWRK